MVVVFRPVDDDWSVKFQNGVLHDQAEQDRYRVIRLIGDEEVHWNKLGAHVMEIIFSHAICEIKETWQELLLCLTAMQFYFNCPTRV
jgi:hypothetical protein